VGRIVVADTSFFHHHPEKLDEIDLSEVLESREAPIGLVVPMVVIDELEKQKNASQKHIRWRSPVTLAVIERTAGRSGIRQVARGRLLRPPRWRNPQRRPVARRAVRSARTQTAADQRRRDRRTARLAVQLLSGKGVTFLTYDTNPTLRARHAGLTDVRKLVSQSERDTGED
jgi:predicted ribonuclease YlaK